VLQGELVQVLVGQAAPGQRVHVGGRLADVAPGLAGVQRGCAELASANRLISRSLAVKAPSLNTGWPNRLVVAVVTTRPVWSSALRNAPIRSSRPASVASKAKTSLSWKFTP